MITDDGTTSQGQTHWTLHVPDEHCIPGLEVGIVATANGVKVGGELITWSDLEKAKEAAQGI